MANNQDGNGFFTGVQPPAYKNYHVNAAGTVLINGIASVVHTITINKPIANGTTTLFNASSTAGTTASNMIANIINTGTTLTEPPLNGVYDAICNNGVVLVTNGTQDVSVSYLP